MSVAIYFAVFEGVQLCNVNRTLPSEPLGDTLVHIDLGKVSFVLTLVRDRIYIPTVVPTQTQKIDTYRVRAMNQAGESSYAVNEYDTATCIGAMGQCSDPVTDAKLLVRERCITILKPNT